MSIPFVLTYSFEAVLKDGLSVFQNSRPNVAKASKLFDLKIYFQTLLLRIVCLIIPYFPPECKEVFFAVLRESLLGIFCNS